MPDLQHKNEHSLALDGADETVIADAIPPKLAHLGAVQRVADAARIIKLSYPLEEELQDPSGNLSVQFVS